MKKDENLTEKETLLFNDLMKQFKVDNGSAPQPGTAAPQPGTAAPQPDSVPKPAAPQPDKGES